MQMNSGQWLEMYILFAVCLRIVDDIFIYKCGEFFFKLPRGTIIVQQQVRLEHMKRPEIAQIAECLQGYQRIKPEMRIRRHFFHYGCNLDSYSPNKRIYFKGFANRIFITKIFSGCFAC